MKRVKLTQGKWAKVDDEDYLALLRHSWHLTGSPNKNQYAGTAIKQKDGSFKRVRMHRLLIRVKPGQEVDHVNGKVLDNRKCNLRVCSKSENLRGARRPKAKASHSTFRGVTWCRRAKKFMAQIRLHLGYFDSEKDAARAYDVKAKELFGEFASPNFP